jgi:hypothetical protein
MKIDPTQAKPEGRAEFPRLSLKKDETARVAILSTKDWEVSVRHYVRGLGYVHCLAIHDAKDELDLRKIEDDGGYPEKCPLCKLSLESKSEKDDLVGPPFRRFAIRVLRYKTNFNGTPTPGGQFWMEIWIVSNEKYRQLRSILEEWKVLHAHDLSLTCSDQTYQKITINVNKEALWMKGDHKEVAAYYRAEAQKYNLMDCLGLSVSKEALEKKLEVARRKLKIEAPIDLGEEIVGQTEETTASPMASDVSELDLFGPTKEVEKTADSPFAKPAAPEPEGEVDFLKELEKDI